ncbi:MAG: hypothetical protein IPM35_40135 [Myxococcales bacterium]|nr:hypothetical protein [Myxococcales bacterium]
MHYRIPHSLLGCKAPFGAGALAHAGGHDFVLARYSPTGMLLSAKA